MKSAPTQERVKLLLNYDPATGVFRWKAARRKDKAGKIAGSDNGKGYIQITIDGVRYAAHRLAWLYVFGRWPADEIDHIDGCRAHNAISNLREADRFLNNQNVSRARINNSTGMLGVTRRRNKYIAQIHAFGKNHHLGYFDTAEAAHDAYMKAKSRMHLTNNIPQI